MMWWSARTRSAARSRPVSERALASARAARPRGASDQAFSWSAHGGAWLCIGSALLASCAARSSELLLDEGAAPAPRLETLSALSQRLGLVRPNPVPARVVAQRASGLVSSSLEQERGARQSWQHDARVTQAPLLSGQVVVFGEGSRLSALDAVSGAVLWSVPDAGALLAGVADDGHFTALVLRDPESSRSWLSVLERSGAERLRLAAERPLGTPALSAGRLLIAWDERFVSVIDVASGAELGRAKLDVPARHALWAGGELFLAGPPWVHFAPSSSTYALPRRPLPGPPELGASNIAWRTDPELTHLVARPRAQPGATAASYLATEGRLALGFEGSRGTLEWVRLLPGVILGVAAGSHSFALCDSTGTLRVLAEDDARLLLQLRLDPPRPGEAAPGVSACVVDLGQSSAGEASAADERHDSLVEQLGRALALSDPDLASAQRFLSRELAARPEPEATRVLIDLASRHNADSVLQAEAEDLLATRRNGAQFMLRALAQSGTDSQDPISRAPIAALAEALLAQGERRAAPLLAARINQPGYSAQALARVSATLEELATEQEYSALRVFFSLQRTTADEPETVEAVTSIARTLLRIGGQPGRRLVEAALRDPLTVPEVRNRLAGLLNAGAPTQAD